MVQKLIMIIINNEKDNNNQMIESVVYAEEITNVTWKLFHVIDQTRETVFHQDIQIPRKELKIRRAAEYF